MCGYCIEQQTLYNLYRQAPDFQSDYFVDHWWWLQEYPDLSQVLQVIPEENLHPTFVLCRGLEILLKDGFVAPEYQALLASPAFSRVLECIAAESPPEPVHFHPPFMAWVREPALYLDPLALPTRLLDWTHQQAHAVLRAYLDYRVMGQGLERNDLEKMFEETGVLDPINDVSQQAHAAVAWHFPAIWLALHSLDEHEENWPVLWALALHTPTGAPAFDGLELWLQRRAALKAFDWRGLGPFLEARAALRPELLQYILTLRTLDADTRRWLYPELDRLEDDIRGEYFCLGEWLEQGFRYDLPG